MIKRILKKNISAETRGKLRDWEKVFKWYINFKRINTPGLIKQRMLKKYAKKYQIGVFIETGTAGGGTVETMMKIFKKIFSIEIDESLFNKAREKFSNHKHIEILNGDSGDILKSFIYNINEPILFWLDGHYSGENTGRGNLSTPIIKELQAIAAHPIKNHVIFIDDARCFNGVDDYPELGKLKLFVGKKMSHMNFSVTDDIIILTPKTNISELKEKIYYFRNFIIDYINLEIINKLPPPTEEEEVLIKEFRENMKKNIGGVSGKRWSEFSKRLKIYARFFDPRNFLQWDIIKLTMVLNSIPEEYLKKIMSSDQWESYWLRGIKENKFGNHVPDKTIRESSGTILAHAFHLYNLQEKTWVDFNKIKNIVEFGGGYGSMCRLTRNLGFDGNYIIFDLPEFLFLQKFYLNGIHVDAVDFNKKEKQVNTNILVKEFDDLKEIATKLEGPSLFIATWSISESPLELRNSIMEIIKDFNFYLFGYQKEFDGVNNEIYFDNLIHKFKNIRWSKIYLNEWDGYYLIGRSNNK